MLTSKEIQTVLKELMENNLFLCDFETDKGIKMCLKNEKDEVVFSFKIEDMTTLQSMRFAINKLKAVIDDAFKLINS